MTEQYINEQIKKITSSGFSFERIVKIKDNYFIYYLDRNKINDCSCNNNCDGCELQTCKSILI